MPMCAPCSLQQRLGCAMLSPLTSIRAFILNIRRNRRGPLSMSPVKPHRDVLFERCRCGWFLHCIWLILRLRNRAIQKFASGDNQALLQPHDLTVMVLGPMAEVMYYWPLVKEYVSLSRLSLNLS
ncbi:hypothetical protein DPMN_194925 [Dreissena polymorpha]|uniref:Uncharacterized protein n=1 Tax=Dreissena polymorpha TaxID=45954 RepID=A0A9D3Y4Z9_DREPO|nr:hypothetical protein DPMN_194925 [Dreissena polymorpha]